MKRTPAESDSLNRSKGKPQSTAKDSPNDSSNLKENLESSERAAEKLASQDSEKSNSREQIQYLPPNYSSIKNFQNTPEQIKAKYIPNKITSLPNEKAGHTTNTRKRLAKYNKLLF